ncbi:MAG TPA: hypothetical protein PKL14_06245 [Holophaga sp.]|nr:hypothetical protein [Holophaga sp.]
MKGKPGCPHCMGRGVILDPDPMAAAKVCECTRSVQAEGEALGIPARYRQAGFDGFWDWWKIQHSKERLSGMLASVPALLESDAARAALSEELASKLELILHKCGGKMASGEFVWKDLKPAQEPQGYRTFCNWARHGRENVDLWWIDGPAGSGRSTLVAAALKAACARSGQGGLFVSVRTFSQELKDTYYDSRSFRNTDFQSERDRMTPLLQAPVLVLDDLDRLDSDIRVVRSIAQLLDQRYADELPTIATASRWAETVLKAENSPLARLEDPSLQRRFSQARRVELRPVLERLMESLDV